MTSLLIATTHATVAGMAVVHDAMTTPRCLEFSDARAGTETSTGLNDDAGIEISIGGSDDGHAVIATSIGIGFPEEDG